MDIKILIFMGLLALGYAEEGRISTADHQYCLGIQNAPGEGASIILQLCNNGVKSQFWDVNWDDVTKRTGAFVSLVQGITRTQVMDEDTTSGFVATWGDAGQSNQRWTFKIQTGNVYLVQNSRTLRCLTKNGGLGSQLKTSDCNFDDQNQLWAIQASQTIKSVSAGNYLTAGNPSNVVNTGSWNGQKSQQWTYRWGLAFGGGTSFLWEAQDNALDEDLNSNRVGNWWYASNARLNQQWYLKRLTGNGWTVQIINVQTNRCMSDQGSAQAVTKVCNEADVTQQWSLNIFQIPAQPKWQRDDELGTKTFDDDDIAIYFTQIPSPVPTWINQFFGDVWRYVKKTYGKMHEGDDKMYFILRNTGGGTVAYWTSDMSSNATNPRNVIFVGSGDWNNASPGWNNEATVHEAAHIVESVSMGLLWSPAFSVWKDSTWASIFQYDVFAKIGRPNDLAHFCSWNCNQAADYPRNPTVWTRDWWLPIYNNYGREQLLVRFFKTLGVHWPKRGNAYVGNMNLGEFVHFFSGAARANLKNQAAIAFGWTAETDSQFNKARSDYNGITY